MQVSDAAVAYAKALELDLGVVRTTSRPRSETGAKKIALVGATYTVDRFERTSEDVVGSLFRRPGASGRARSALPPT